MKKLFFVQTGNTEYVNIDFHFIFLSSELHENFLWLFNL